VCVEFDEELDRARAGGLARLFLLHCEV